MLTSLIAFLLVFGLIVLVHELGHFLMARRYGIKVLEFGFGYPPRVATLGVRDGVEYTLNAIPVGGFVRMLGEEDPSDPQSFASKGAGARILTLLAGSLMNLALAAVLFAGAFMLGQQVPVGQVRIEAVVPGSPAEVAGMQPGDIIVALQGERLRNSQELVERTQTLLGTTVEVELLRGGSELSVRLVPRTNPPAGEGAMGISITMGDDVEWVTERSPVWQAVPMAVREVGLVLVETVRGFAQMIRGGVSSGAIAGPVGIVQLGAAVVQTGLSNLMRFVAFLSINLFVVNLLPLPALDGGRIAFILLEKFRGGRRLAPEREGLVHLLGLLLLLGLVAIVSYFDIARILGGGRLLP